MKKFKFKYITWILNVITIWLPFYLLKDINLRAVWWSFPAIITALVIFAFFLCLTIFYWLEDK